MKKLLLLLALIPIIAFADTINCNNDVDIEFYNEVIIDQSRIIREQAEKIGRLSTRVKILRRQLRS